MAECILATKKATGRIVNGIYDLASTAKAVSCLTRCSCYVAIGEYCLMLLGP